MTSTPHRWLEQFQSRLQSLPEPKTEESIVFRILVQLMVIVGIVATDVAAQTTWSLWAIPLSIIGSCWSWRQRKKKNIALKFCWRSPWWPCCLSS
ncbi:hypothetical protein [Synechocystis salina]|uniref:hypothetical protein n=1 Tax=Synechocystis salina TaxID=945780 RepID=UPI001D14A6BC|nr:hypothetical protein [Synechocystis salina]